MGGEEKGEIKKVDWTAKLVRQLTKGCYLGKKTGKQERWLGCFGARY